MAIYNSNDEEGILGTINVTPLVDIMLVLLIIFMVTTTFMLNPAIPVSVPRAANAEDPPIKAFSLVMEKDGQLYINGEKTDRQEASEALRKAVKQEPQVQVIIAADGQVSYQSVIWIIDLVKSSGVTDFALNVQKEG